MEKRVREKALCYVVRDGRLLVLRHLDYPLEETGLQVPAGGVKAGETPEAAALREAEEETGLAGLRVVRKLGEFFYDVSPYRWEIQHLHVFLLEAPGQVPERWESREEHDGQGPPTRLECSWIPLERAHVLAGGQGALIGRLFE